MLTYLEKLKKKPEPERKKAVLMISLVITILIAVVWSGVLFIRIQTTDFSFQDRLPGDNVPSLKDSFSNFGDQVNRIIHSANSYAATGTPSTDMNPSDAASQSEIPPAIDTVSQ